MLTSAAEAAMEANKQPDLLCRDRAEFRAWQEADLAAAGREAALANYRAMPPSVRRTCAAHYASAKKPETKAKRLLEIASRLDKNLKPM
jgi:uncharacterized protein YdeI (YjbR/CyaY-like superfamily)